MWDACWKTRACEPLSTCWMRLASHRSIGPAYASKRTLPPPSSSSSCKLAGTLLSPITTERRPRPSFETIISFPSSPSPFSNKSRTPRRPHSSSRPPRRHRRHRLQHHGALLPARPGGARSTLAARRVAAAGATSQGHRRSGRPQRVSQPDGVRAWDGGRAGEHGHAAGRVSRGVHGPAHADLGPAAVQGGWDGAAGSAGLRAMWGQDGGGETAVNETDASECSRFISQDSSRLTTGTCIKTRLCSWLFV